MFLSISTANLYMLPFPSVLSIYQRAGYEHIELAGHWQGGEWETAQHLRGIPPKDVVAMVRDSGLRIATFHDMGGVIGEGNDSIIAPQTLEYFDYEAFRCVVFHVPHRRDVDSAWWRAYQSHLVKDVQRFPEHTMVCLENMPPLHGYFVPMIDPAEMRAFLAEAGLFANVDTTHYAQSGIDILSAADTLGPLVKAVHLSDYAEKSRSAIGTGALDLAGFVKRLPLDSVHAITIEADIWAEDENRIVENAVLAKARVLEMVST